MPTIESIISHKYSAHETDTQAAPTTYSNYIKKREKEKVIKIIVNFQKKKKEKEKGIQKAFID